MESQPLSPSRQLPFRDLADLMVWLWFSLAKAPRRMPIAFEQGDVRIRVEPAGRFGIATIWDADLLLWAASQWTEALDNGKTPTRQLDTSPYRLLRNLGRGTGCHDYTLLRAAFDRLTATRVDTTLRAVDPSEPARFRWLEAWEPIPGGVRLTLPDWLFAAVRAAADQGAGRQGRAVGEPLRSAACNDRGTAAVGKSRRRCVTAWREKEINGQQDKGAVRRHS